MWGLEHAAMAIAAFVSIAWFAIGRNWNWLRAAILSQVPFWLGALAYFLSGDAHPTEVNLCANLMLAAIFYEQAKRLQRICRGGIIQIWLCLIFLVASSFDVVNLLLPFGLYMWVQEIAHYSALMVIGGRAYVRVIDGNHRNRRDYNDPKRRGKLV